MCDLITPAAPDALDGLITSKPCTAIKCDQCGACANQVIRLHVCRTNAEIGILDLDLCLSCADSLVGLLMHGLEEAAGLDHMEEDEDEEEGSDQ